MPFLPSLPADLPMLKIQSKCPFLHEALPDDNHSHLTNVTRHPLLGATGTVLGKYRGIKILRVFDLEVEIPKRVSSCHA